MTRAVLSSIAFFLVVAPAFAKGRTTKITIEGGGLEAPITLTDPQVLASFNIWSGPGTGGCESPKLLPCDPPPDRDVKSYAPSFVVDWSQGIVGEPPPAIPRDKVSFWSDERPGELAYVVTYVFDPATKQGYIYLPHKNGSITRGIEGNWFRAWSVWDKVAGPLIAGRL